MYDVWDSMIKLSLRKEMIAFSHLKTGITAYDAELLMIKGHVEERQVAIEHYLND